MRRQVIFSLLVVFVPVMSSAQNMRLDPIMEDIIRTRLQVDGALTSDDMSRLTALVVDQRTIRTFSGIEVARNLVSLRVTNCQIEDFNSIGTLVNLKELHVRNCKIGDISPLANLSGLSHLSLTDNEIKDLAPLLMCTELTWLDLRRNAINSLSALRTLDKLVRLDIRDNPLGSSSMKFEIDTIITNNPNVDVCLRPGSDMTDPNEIQKRLSAKAAIADFALFAQWHYIDGYPNLPKVPPSVSNALLLLRRANDREHLADVAVLLMRYAIDIMARNHTGTLLSSENQHPFVAEFLSVAPRKQLGDEIVTTFIANWVHSNRSVLPASLVLDAYVEKYLHLIIELDKKWLQDIEGNNK